MRFTPRWLLPIMFTGLLAACGFQLRGEVQLPPELATMRVVVADAYSPLQRNLEQALARSGARAPVGKERSATLRISRNSMRRWPLTVGSAGRVQEYSMRYEVTMQLNDAEGKVVVPRQDIELERSYQFETIRAQGTPGEEEVVRAELERDMVQAVLRRIDAVLAGR
jgi:LPS-assembly lipoprotein